MAYDEEGRATLNQTEAAAVDFKCPVHKKPLMYEEEEDFMTGKKTEQWICYDCANDERTAKQEGE